MVDAGTTEVRVISNTEVWVSRGNVTGYELKIVDAGKMEVSTRVKVSCGNTEVTVLYRVDVIVPAGREVVIEIISVKVLAGRMEVSVTKKVLAGRIKV